MRILVTGAAGFVGGYLIRELEACRHTVIAVDAAAPDKISPEWHTLDLLDADRVGKLVCNCKPDAVAHLAAVASVPRSQANPEHAFRVNTGGTLNVLRMLRRYAPDARTLVVSTAQVYGNRRRSKPVREDAVLEPGNPYAESKAWADFIALLYAERLGMPVMTARPHNHTGPGQATTYAVPAFARQVAEVARGKTQPPMNVGNLDSRRDITDVRDVVAAYRLLIERGHSGSAYNIASGSQVTMREVIEYFCKFAGIKPHFKIDSELWRPTDESTSLDTTAVCKHTGWTPRIRLKDTLRDVWSAEY